MLCFLESFLKAFLPCLLAGRFSASASRASRAGVGLFAAAWPRGLLVGRLSARWDSRWAVLGVGFLCGFYGFAGCGLLAGYVSVVGCRVAWLGFAGPCVGPLLLLCVALMVVLLVWRGLLGAVCRCSGLCLFFLCVDVVYCRSRCYAGCGCQP